MSVSLSAVVLTVAIRDKITLHQNLKQCTTFFLFKKKSGHGETKAAKLNSVLISK